MGSGNILILTCSFSSNQLLVVMCYIHCKNELLRDLLFVLLVSSGKTAIFFLPKKYSQSDSCDSWRFIWKIPVKEYVTEFMFSKFQLYSL